MDAVARDLDIVFIESHDGGSHRDFRLGLARHSRHRYRALTLPPRFWKWRMRGAALWFADLLAAEPEPCDLLLVTSLLNVADLRGLLPPPLDRRPLVLYMHENQLTYPLSPEEEFDFHFGFTSILNCLAADLVLFNSDFQRDLFLESMPDYLGRMPEAVPRGLPNRIAARSRVLAVGLAREPRDSPVRAVWRGSEGAPDAGPPWPRDGRRPVILWNHRWEFDKRPDLLVAALDRLLARGLDFAVMLLGEGRHREAVFAPLAARLGDRCLQFGHVEDRARYEALLDQADIVVSCAEQEYFGISVAEAVHAGCYPVLPRRQVYPSLYGTRCRGRHFYTTEDELVDLLADLIGGRDCGHMCSLAGDMDAFCWPRLAPHYDDLLQAVAASAGKTQPSRQLRPPERKEG
jgi:glycosyltransferase involved in cell wall biosynthesis